MFITIDGIDGAGKTTLVVGLAKWLFESFGVSVLLTKEPTRSSPWAKKLRAAALTKRLPKEQELELFHKDRLWHLKHEIYPALGQKQIVICDRYVDSTLAYQASDKDEADILLARMGQEIAIPDLTFILDCPVDICLDRIGKRNQPITSFERSETLERARAIFNSRVGGHYRHLDGIQSPSDLLASAQKEILPFIGGENNKGTRRSVLKAVDPKSSTFRIITPVLA